MAYPQHSNAKERPYNRVVKKDFLHRNWLNFLKHLFHSCCCCCCQCHFWTLSKLEHSHTAWFSWERCSLQLILLRISLTSHIPISWLEIQKMNTNRRLTLKQLELMIWSQLFSFIWKQKNTICRSWNAEILQLNLYTKSVQNKVVHDNLTFDRDYR